MGISSLAVLGGGVAIYAFLDIGRAVERITENRVPTVLASMRLSRQAERLVAAAPALVAATTTDEHEERVARIRSEVTQLNAILEDLKRRGIDPSIAEALDVSARLLTLNLISLDTTVGNALLIGDERQALGVDAQVAVSNLRKTLESAAATAPSLAPLRLQAAALADRLGAAATAADRASLDELGRHVADALDRFLTQAGSLDPSRRAVVTKQAEVLRGLIKGPRSVLRARALEIDARTNARRLLEQSAQASGRLTEAVDQLVLNAEQDIRRAGERARQQQWISTAVLVTVVVLSLAGSALIVWLYVERSLVRRLTSLSGSMLSIADGDLDTPIPTGGTDEIASMADALKVFRAATSERAAAEHARANLSRYFSPNLADHLAEHPDTLELGGERRDLTFLFTDLAGFTPLVERLDPTVVVAVMNEYIGGLAGIVFDHGGTVDTVVGDAVHAIFGAPLAQADHAERAVSAALAIDRFAQDFVERKSAEGIPVGVTRVGVHTGSAIVGNFGGGSFFHYTAHGDAVNTAARLETANKALGTRLCVSAETVSLIPGFSGRPVGDLVLKGKVSEIGAFEPVEPDESGSERLQAYLAAFDLLEKRDPGCLQAFASYVGAHGNEPLASFHLKRLLAGQINTRIELDAE